MKNASDVDGINLDLSIGGLDASMPSMAVDLSVDFEIAQKPTEPNPLDCVEYEGRIEADCPKEISALLSAFKKRAQEEAKRFRQATDSEFWAAICFQTREQKEEFLKAMDWLRHGDKYLDGTAIAKQMKIAIPLAEIKYAGEKPDTKMASLPSIIDPD